METTTMNPPKETKNLDIYGDPPLEWERVVSGSGQDPRPGGGGLGEPLLDRHDAAGRTSTPGGGGHRVG